MTDHPDRNAFERWLAKKAGVSVRLLCKARRTYGYDQHHTDAAWDAWQAALAHARSIASEAAAERRPHDCYALHPRDAWHEDDGDVLWHRIDEYRRVCEPPVVGNPNSSAWDDGGMRGHTHWSRLPDIQPFIELAEPRDDRGGEGGDCG